MSSKFKILIVSVGLLISANAHSSYKTLSPSSFNALYSLAAHGNVSSINSAIARGLNINAVNEDGDTGLCVAAKRRDRTAFKSFLQAGANTYHPCTYDIRGYRDFMEQVVNNYNPPKRLDTAVNAQKLTKSGMSWKTKTLIGAGVVAAGAGAALALGGGGGGGSDDNKVDPNCVHGTYINGYCTCYPGYAGTKCNTCDTGYGTYDDTNNCYKTLSCENGSTQKGGKCECKTGYAGELCNVCAPGYGRTKLDSGGATLECVPKSQKYTAFQTIDGFGNIIYNNANFNYNAASVDSDGNKIEDTGVIEVNNNDEFRDVYGMFYDAGKTPHNIQLEQTKVTNNYSEYVDVKEIVKEKVTDENGVPLLDPITGNYLYEDKEQDVTKYIGYGAENQKISITNNSDGDVYGIYSNNADTIYNTYVDIKGSGSAATGTHKAIIEISRDTNYKGNGDNYGIYSENKIYTAHGKGDAAKEGTNITLISEISIGDDGHGNSYGLYNPSQKGEVYNISSDAFPFTSESSIYIENDSDGSIYGIYGLGKIENSGTITLEANKGNAYGIYHIGQSSLEETVTANDAKVKNFSQSNTSKPSPAITASSNSGEAYGIWAKNSIISNEHVISVKTKSADKTNKAYGIYADKSHIFNSSGIYSTNTNGDAYGIYNKGGKVTNTTQIYEIVVNAENGTAYGIYSDGGTVSNSGRIIATGKNAYGIYATNGATVTNTGEFYFLINGYAITPDNIKCTSSGCKGKDNNNAYAIYLKDGAKLVNEGSISSASVLSLPQGTQIGTGGKFTATSISGDLAVASDVVNKGFDTSYTLNNAVDTPDASGLKISSESVLFDASLQGSDIVLNKKDFNSLIDNHDVAQFLEQNYVKENSEQLFAGLKSATSVKEFNKITNSLTGQDIISRFADEDLIMSRELDFDMNEKIFNLPAGKFSLANDISTKIFDDSASHTSYMLSGMEFANARLGVGLAIQEIVSSDADNSNSRHSQNFQFMAPLQFKNSGFNTIITPKFAYAYGTYDRDGFENQNFDGTIEKQTTSLSSQTRYPFKLFGFDIAPTAEANVSAYQTKISEDNKPYALSSDDTTYSATLGMGAYLSSNKEFAKNHKLNFMFGAMLYHEFADPHTLKLKMNGMNGSFTLHDENRKNNYAVLRSKFDYAKDNISLYADFLSYIDSQYRTRVDLGLKYNF